MRFWFAVMDLMIACGGLGSRAYLWVLRRASNVTEHERGAKPGEEGPW